MGVDSMTGFARAEGELGPHGSERARWELRSVNGKGLDARLRLPAGFEAIEAEARRRIQARFSRGNVQAGLQISGGGERTDMRINEMVLERAILAAREIANDIGSAPPTADGLLGLKGVIELVEPTRDDAEIATRDAAALALLDQALDDLAAMRGREGAALAATLGGLLDEIARLTGEAAASAETQPQAIRERLLAQLKDLGDAVPALSEERLAQEIALIAAKADIREEIDRLEAHIAQARELLETNGPVGRKLDFLAQEFNREANTLCSKSTSIPLTRIGLELKTAIDRVKEQVQNVA